MRQDLSVGTMVDTLVLRMGIASKWQTLLKVESQFLDNDLIDFSGRIPPEYLMEIENITRKSMSVRMRLLMIWYLNSLKENINILYMSPDWHIFSKTRVGKELVDEYLSKERINETGIFNYKFITLALFSSGYIVSRFCHQKAARCSFRADAWCPGIAGYIRK